MALNREQKRMLQRQGELGPDGEPVRTRRGPQQAQRKERTGPDAVRQGSPLRAAQGGLAHPSETINYSIIILITLVVFTLFIFGVDWVFAEFVLKLFNAS